MTGLKIKTAPSLKLIINTIIGLTLYSVITNVFFTDDNGTGLVNYNSADNLTHDNNLSFIYIAVVSVAVSFIIWLINRYGIFNVLTIKNKQQKVAKYGDDYDVDEHITFAGIGAVCRRNVIKSKDLQSVSCASSKRETHGLMAALQHVSEKRQYNKNDKKIKKPLFSRRAMLAKGTIKNSGNDLLNKKIS